MYQYLELYAKQHEYESIKRKVAHAVLAEGSYLSIAHGSNCERWIQMLDGHEKVQQAALRSEIGGS